MNIYKLYKIHASSLDILKKKKDIFYKYLLHKKKSNFVLNTVILIVINLLQKLQLHL